MFMKLSDFVPKGQERNRRALVSAKMILQIDATVFVVSMIMIFGFRSLGFEAGMYVCYFTLIGTMIHAALMYACDSITLPVYFFCFSTIVAFFTLSVYSGGLSSSFAFWLITIAPIGMFYLKKYEGMFWSFLTLAAVLSMPIMEATGYLPLNQLSSTNVTWINFINIFGVCIAFMFTVNGFKTANKKITAKLAAVNKRLEYSNSELEKFASVASHDLKSPLRNITGFLTLLKRNESQFDEKSKEFIEIIDSNAKSMTRLIEDILEYSRTNGSEVNKENVDLNRAVSQIRSQIVNANIFPDAVINVDKMPEINTDKTRIHQVFQNLIENGLKYNRSKNPKMDIRYHMRNKQHHFEFIDNGIGIDAKHAGKIFEMFKRLHNQSEFSGSGIGLATTKKNVEILGGTITFISVPGRGTTFRVNLPVLEQDFMPTNKQVMARSEES